MRGDAVRFEVVEINAGANKLVLSGRLDSTTVAAVETPFTAAIAATGRSAMLDLTRLDFISSLGIRLLLSAARVVARRGGRVVLFGAQPMVAEVLTAMSLDEVMPLVPGEAEALARLAG
jgi:anti-anti-sigma factor